MNEIRVPEAATTFRGRALLHLEVVCVMRHSVVCLFAIFDAIVSVAKPPDWHGQAR